ncbi:MAG: TRAP transporter substrate-binding protein [Alphaproteobacteria bacterium]|nr:TRAP transporter substrate-binding protein [Alphaproteobacteria bacterium]
MSRQVSRRAVSRALAGAMAAPAIIGHANAQALTIRFANSSGEQALSNLFAARFLRMLEERTSGAIKGQLLLNAGSEQSILESISVGTMDIANTGYSGMRELDVFYVPFLMRDLDHALRISRSPLFEKARGVAQARYKARLIGLGSSGSFNVGTKEKIGGWKDLAGMKIRVPPFEAYTEAAKALSISATPVPFNEVYLALQQNLVAGLITLVNVMLASRFNEVCKHVVSNDFGVGTEKFWCSERCWNRMSPQQRDIFVGLFNEIVGEHYFGAAKRQAAEDFKLWEQRNGAGTVLTLDSAELSKIMQPVGERLANEVYGPGAYQQIQAL